MKKHLVAAAIASAFAFATAAFAQQQMQAVVIITDMDPANRIVKVEAKTAKRTLHLSPDIDMSQLQVGSRYLIRYTEGLATAIEPGASAAGGGTREIERTGKGAGVSRAKVVGVVDALDTSGRKLTLRTPDGEKETFSMGDGVSAGSVKTGDTVTVSFQRPLASQVKSTPQAVSDPAPPQ
jgi:hypothetical protein